MTATRVAAALLLIAAASARADAQHAQRQHGAAHEPPGHGGENHGGHGPGAAPAHALHVRLTDPRRPAAGDSARLAALTHAVRRGIARYRDVRAADRAGYKPIFVGDTSAGQVLHYTHLMHGVWETWRLDPAKPGSLLYEKRRDGSLRLVGAMYNAPDTFTPEQLDARVPLAYARWHLHTDLCLPRPVWSKEQWARRLPDGRPAFGPDSPVATRAACERAGGEFKDHMFGWMVHAMVADHTRLADVWGGGHDMAPGTATAPPAARR